jgi:hypothetical protein
MSVFGELRPTSINGLSSLDLLDTLTATQVIASNLYTKAETDELLANVSSNSNDLDAKQDLITSTTFISRGPLVVTVPQYGTSLRTGSSVSYLRVIEGHHMDSFTTSSNVGRQLFLQYYTGANAGVRIGNNSGSLGINVDPAYALHVVGNASISTTLVIGGNFSAPNIYTKSEVDSLIAEPIADGSLTIAKTSGLNDALLTKASVSSLVAGLSSKQDKIDSFSTLNTTAINTINADVSGTLTAKLTQVVVAGTTNEAPTSAEIGSTVSLTRFTHGHHIDSITRANGVGRVLALNYYSNIGVRFGNNNGKISINCEPSNYQLDCIGAGRFSSFVSASNYVSTSDQRIKENVQDASLDECLRRITA